MIAAIESEILAGNPDIHGLCPALSDWSAEFRILTSGEIGIREQQSRRLEHLEQLHVAAMRANAAEPGRAV